MLKLTQMHGFNARGKIPVKIVSLGSTNTNWNGTTVSAPVNFDLGQEAASRYIVILYVAEMDAVPTSMTLEGVSCNQEVSERDATADLSAEIWTVSKPTGTTDQTLTITINTSQNDSARVYLYSVYNVTDINFAFDSGSLSTFEGTTLSWNLAVPVGGAVFGCAAITTGATETWTGIDEVFDNEFGESFAARELPLVATPHSISVVKSSSIPPMVAAVMSVG